MLAVYSKISHNNTPMGRIYGDFSSKLSAQWLKVSKVTKDLAATTFI
jgi:hypothetical protein